MMGTPLPLQLNAQRSDLHGIDGMLYNLMAKDCPAAVSFLGGAR